MWKTSQGDRILKGAEAELIREILSTLWADFQNGAVDEYGVTTGVVLFDALERNQQIAMLLHVGESLLVSQETPELTAVSRSHGLRVVPMLVNRHQKRDSERIVSQCPVSGMAAADDRDKTRAGSALSRRDP